MNPVPAFRKVVNAFIPGATPKGIPGPGLREANRLLGKWGGLWVGGSVECTNESLTFKANALNEACHENLTPIVIPSNQVCSVRREFGWITGIVVVCHQNGEFCFRCYGAKRVAEKLSSVFGLA